MSPFERLRRLATRYHDDGPARRRADARTILAILDELDDQAARVFFARFVQKWGLDDEGEPQEPVAETPPAEIIPLVRRRPMLDLERAVIEELERDEAEASDDAQGVIIITFEQAAR